MLAPRPTESSAQIYVYTIIIVDCLRHSFHIEWQYWIVCIHWLLVAQFWCSDQKPVSLKYMHIHILYPINCIRCPSAHCIDVYQIIHVNMGTRNIIIVVHTALLCGPHARARERTRAPCLTGCACFCNYLCTHAAHVDVVQNVECSLTLLKHITYIYTKRCITYTYLHASHSTVHCIFLHSDNNITCTLRHAMCARVVVHAVHRGYGGRCLFARRRLQCN